MRRRANPLSFWRVVDHFRKDKPSWRPDGVAFRRRQAFRWRDGRWLIEFSVQVEFGEVVLTVSVFKPSRHSSRSPTTITVQQLQFMRRVAGRMERLGFTGSIRDWHFSVGRTVGATFSKWFRSLPALDRAVKSLEEFSRWLAGRRTIPR